MRRKGLLGRLALGLFFLAIFVVIIWWRGPNWSQVGQAFAQVSWIWVAAAVLMNLLSVLVRASAWRTVIVQSLPRPRPRFVDVFSAFAVGLGANALLPGRVGELARVWVLKRKLERERRAKQPGLWAKLGGTVIAHRSFDLFPVLLLVVYVLMAARLPAWATTSLWVVLGLGAALFLAALLLARREGAAALDELGSLRRLIAAAREGLSVLRSPWAALLAAFFQLLGWTTQLLAVDCALRAFHIDSALPVAALVLVLVNVATVFPLWPGNVGLLQAAIALPLRSYGVRYGHGFAFGVGLQAIEASVGVAVGLLFIAREGLSLGKLRQLEDVAALEEELPASEV